MHRFRTLLMLLLLANWFACTAHCTFLKTQVAQNSCGSDSAGFSLSQGADDDQQVCDWVMSGGYESPKARVAAPALVTAVLPTFPVVDLCNSLLPPRLNNYAGWNASPLLTATFLFVCRTALPPRAPSLLS